MTLTELKIDLWRWERRVEEVRAREYCIRCDYAVPLIPGSELCADCLEEYCRD